MDEFAIAAMARDLGWGKFSLFIYEVPEPDDPGKPSTLAVWMECHEWSTDGNSEDLFLQINRSNETADELWMCVFAIRYRICTGWRRFVVDSSPTKRRKEIERLSPFFHASHFITPERRKTYRENFPQACGYTWKKVREEGVPEL